MRIYPLRAVVRDPVKRDIIPPQGRDVPDDDQYWHRRLIAEDVTKTPPKAASSSAKVDKPAAVEGSETQ